jgi:hypothetical protein
LRLAVFAIALVVRLVAIEVTGPQHINFGDAGDYVDAARWLCVAHAYPARGNLPFFRAPGLPFFIAGVTACHPMAVRAVKYGLAVCDAVTCVLIAMLGVILSGAKDPLRTCAGGPSPSSRLRMTPGGWIAGLIAALDPFFIADVCDVRSEPLFMMLLTLSIWLLLRDRSALSGVSLALAALTRPVALIAIPLFAVYRLRRGWVLILASLLTLAPWTIRNYVRFQKVIVVNDAGGYNLWRGAHPAMRHIAEIRDPVAFHRASVEFETAAARLRGVDFNRLALEEIRAHPAEVAAFTLKKAWIYWRPWLDPREYPVKVVIASGVFEGMLILLGALGMARFKELGCPALIFFVVLWLAHIPFQVVFRFRMPITDPLLIAFAASWLDRARVDADSRSRSAAVAPA